MSHEKLETIDPEIEPEYVGAHSMLTSEQCQNWMDDDSDTEDFHPTQCERTATHTVVMADGSGLHGIAMCDSCGTPEDVTDSERNWTGDLRQKVPVGRANP